MHAAFRLAILLAFLPTSFLPAQAPPPLTAPDLDRWLDSLVPPTIRAADIAGLAIAVVKDGQVLTARGFGAADLGANLPMTAATVVRAASVSKTFTAIAVMQQVERGALDLDRDVNEYLDFRIPAAFGQPITLRHLLTHTAGFEETSYKRWDPPRSLHDFAAEVPDRIFPPGTIPAYSNYGLTLAGYIVSRTAGEPFGAYVERHILSPLGMTRSVFRFTIPAALGPAARMYPAASREPYPDDLFGALAAENAPAAALATTAADMTRMMLALLQGGEVDGIRILEPASVAAMESAAFVPIEGVQPIGMGLFRTDSRGHRVIGHSGDGEGAHADLKLLPDLGTGVFIAMNSDGVETDFLPAVFAVRSRLFEAFVDRYFPTPPPADQPTVATAREHAALLAGEYVWSRQPRGDYQEALGMIPRFALGARIRDNGDGTITTPAFLTFEPSGRTQVWREVGDFVWREVGGTARLVAKVDAGRVRSVWTDQAAAVWIDLPVPAIKSAWLNIPLLLGATGVLLLTTLSWPVAALLRRRRGGPPPRRTATLARLAALLGAAAMIGWGVVMGTDLASKVGSEPVIRIVQLLTLGAAAGTVAAIANVGSGWAGRGTVGRIGSLLVALALADLAWFAFAFHLLSVRLG
ncbi:MAG: serine hydrolase domain-containing protein [Gemmatimonadales bacterium]